MHRLDRYLIVCIAALGLALPVRLPAEEGLATDPAPPAAAGPVTEVPPVAAPVTDQTAAAPVATTDAATVASVAAGASGGVTPAAVAVGGSGFADADRLVVHKSKRQLELLKAGAVIAQYPIRLGLNPAGHKLHEGDFRTPEGHYYLSRRNPRSEFFLSIGVSYPNDADRRRARGNGKAPGGSIMIHGHPNVPRKPADYYARNDWTDGCIAVSNSDMVDIWLRTKVGLPIEIRP
jgi:L,D-transpeptidase catalytic domain